MNCAHCGQPSNSNDKFCAYCGQSLAPPKRFCTQCGAEIRAGARFCAQCGQAQTTAPGAGDAPAAPPGKTPAAGPPPTAAPGPVPVPPTKIPSLDKIKQMFSEGAKEQARDLLSEFVKGKPKDAAAWTTLGEFHRELDQVDLAEQAYQTALKLDSRQVQAHIGLGILDRMRGDYIPAMDHYIAALKVNPRSGHALSSAAVVAMKLGDDARAVEFAERAWELEKNDASIAANLCIAYHYAGRTRDRDRMYKQAQRMKYGSMENLDKILRGELSVRA